jgi:phospholipid/cholesterol/gamma-HCH transport system ATP-binding protein
VSLLRLEDVHVAFGDHVVLDGFSLEVERGETMCLLGRSGTGKSVMLRLILGLLRPQRGAIWLGDCDVTRASERELIAVRAHIGMVFQAGALFDSLTVGENVGYGLQQHGEITDEEIERRVDECLSFVDLLAVKDLLPAALSGGMKKRVAVARAIAPRPELMLYDEPTTGLDPATAGSVDALINSLKRELAVTGLVVTHDIRTVLAVADRIAVLEHGRAAWIGEPDALRSSTPPAPIEAFLGEEVAT